MKTLIVVKVSHLTAILKIFSWINFSNSFYKELLNAYLKNEISHLVPFYFVLIFDTPTSNHTHFIFNFDGRHKTHNYYTLFNTHSYFIFMISQGFILSNHNRLIYEIEINWIQQNFVICECKICGFKSTLKVVFLWLMLIVKLVLILRIK